MSSGLYDRPRTAGGKFAPAGASTPPTAAPAQNDAAAALAAAMAQMVAGLRPEGLDAIAAQMADVAARLAAVEAAAPRVVQYQIGNAAPGPVVKNARPELDRLMRLAVAAAPARRNFWLYGPPGTGKSVLASTAAQSLGLSFTEIQVNVATTPAAIIGSATADGTWVEPEFVRSWELGGVILLDELTTNQDLCGALNNALANGTLAIGRHHDAARRSIPRHRDCYVIVADNTTGRGNSGGTLTRCRLDAANIDRFIGRFLFVGYWKELEARLAGSLADHLWALRDTLATAWPVTTRTFTAAADYLAAGWNETETAAQLLHGAEPAVLDKARLTSSFWKEALS
jgi:MoxR-like ATPase